MTSRTSIQAPSTADVGLRRKARKWHGFFVGHRQRRGDRRERRDWRCSPRPTTAGPIPGAVKA